MLDIRFFAIFAFAAFDYVAAADYAYADATTLIFHCYAFAIFAAVFRRHALLCLFS